RWRHPLPSGPPRLSSPGTGTGGGRVGRPQTAAVLRPRAGVTARPTRASLPRRDVLRRGACLGLRRRHRPAAGETPQTRRDAAADRVAAELGVVGDPEGGLKRGVVRLPVERGMEVALVAEPEDAAVLVGHAAEERRV